MINFHFVHFRKDGWLYKENVQIVWKHVILSGTQKCNPKSQSQTLYSYPGIIASMSCYPTILYMFFWGGVSHIVFYFIIIYGIEFLLYYEMNLFKEQI